MQNPTITTATSDCISAEANDSTIPPPPGLAVGDQIEDITALPWPGPAA